MRIISVYPNFANQGGAQDRAIQLATHFNDSKPVILTETPTSEMLPAYANAAIYEKFSFSNVKKYATKDTIFLTHHRKLTTKLVLYNWILGNKLKIVHCARNTFSNLRYLTLFPKNIIAISDGVKDNLISYFKVPKENVTVIYNGIRDYRNFVNTKEINSNIKILLAARICPVKRQIEIVKSLQNNIPSNIFIDFAGSGPDEKLLIETIGDSPNFRYIGHIKMEEHLNQYDYVMLFSEKEGFGSSLLYGLMFGKPLITNDTKVMRDTNEDKEVGFIFKDLEQLKIGLKTLPIPSSPEYKEMSEKARKKYEEKFREEIMFSNYSIYLKNILN